MYYDFRSKEDSWFETKGGLVALTSAAAFAVACGYLLTCFVFCF